MKIWPALNDLGQDRNLIGRLHIEKINAPFLADGGLPAEYGAGLARAIERGWLWKHESGTYVKFTPAGAELFA